MIKIENPRIEEGKEMIKEIRFILSEHDDSFEELLQEKMKPFTLDKDTIEENGDAGTTITIVFTIIQTALSIPSFIAAMHEIIRYTKQKKEDKSSEKKALVDHDCSWKFMINGSKYDLSGLPSNEERFKVLDRILERHTSK